MTTESQRISELEGQINILSSEIIKLETNITRLARELSEEKQRVSGLEFHLNKKLQAIESSKEFKVTSGTLDAKNVDVVNSNHKNLF